MGEPTEKSIEKQQLRRARITAVVLASATVVSLVSLVFAFIKKTEAEKQWNYFKGLEVEIQEFKLEAEQQRVLAEQAFIEAQVARDQLSECKGRTEK
jgi:uncharacterized membrane protein